MHIPHPRELLQAWELGTQASPARRGLLLMGVALPQTDPAALLQAPIGQRDAWLLDLRETLFGSRVECLLACAGCGQQNELDFEVADIRTGHAGPGQVCTVPDGVRERRYRLPASADLLAIEGEPDVRAAEQALLWRCRLDPAAGAPAPDAAPPGLLEAAGRAMSEADRQAEVLLELACPACGRPAVEVFDIVDHLWRELDHWAVGMLRKVHALASRHGWSEDAILALSPARRAAYLDLIGES
jgi:hypothetical protein